MLAISHNDKQNLRHRLCHQGLVGFSRFAILAILMLGIASTCEAQALASNSQQPESTKIDQLVFKFEKPRTVTIYPGDTDRTGSGVPTVGRVYWYLPYTMMNSGSRSSSFFVSINASSDKGRKYSDLALAYVEKKIERMERRKLLSKVDLKKQPGVEKGGQIWAGYQKFEPKQSREYVAIFNPLDREADTIVITVAGLINDITVEKLGETKFKISERVLEITYKRPGDEYYTSLDKFKLVGKKWVTKVRTFDMQDK